MSDTADLLAVLRRNYAKGVLSLEQGGEKVTFASGDEMRRRIRDLEAEVASASGLKTSGITYPEFDKGV